MQTFQALFEFYRKRYESQNECLIDCQVGSIRSGDVVLDPLNDNQFLMIGVMYEKSINRTAFQAVQILFIDEKSKGMLSSGLTNVKEQLDRFQIIEMPGINFRAGDVIDCRDKKFLHQSRAHILVSGFKRDDEGNIQVVSNNGNFNYAEYSDRLVVVKPSAKHHVYGQLVQMDGVTAALSEVGGKQSEKDDIQDQRLPQWLRDLDDSLKAKVSHIFCLTGNINDYQLFGGQVGNKLSVIEMLSAQYPEFKYQMKYSLGKGLAIEDTLMELAFKEEYADQLAPEQNASILGQEMFKQQKNDPLSSIIGKSPEKIFPFLDRVFTPVSKGSKMENRKMLIFDFANDIFPATDNPTRDERISIEAVIGWARNKQMSEDGHLIILLAPSASKMNCELRAADSGIKFLRLPKPDVSQRYVVFQRAQVDFNTRLNGASLETLAGVTNGLTCIQIDNIAKLAERRKEELSLESVRRAKEDILAKEFDGNLKIKLPRYGFENFGGKENLKAYFRNINENLSKGILRRVPMGILVPGPPGTGKTCFLECFAKESGFTVVELGNLRSMFVGESERISNQVFEALDDLAPVIVIEDEADQSDTSRDSYQGDAGVANRIRQMTFKFRSAEQRRGRVIWFSLTNRIDLIDEALKRKGRADEIIPFVLPDKTEYASIFSVMFRRHRISADFNNIVPFVEVVAKLEYVTGADIEWMVLEADKLASYEKISRVSPNHLMQAIDSWVSPSDPREIDRQTILAIEKSSKQLRPINWQELLDRAKERQQLTIG